MKTKIIAFSGKKQSGKDTLARFAREILPNREVLTLGFATPLKRMVVDYLGVPEHQIFGSNEDKSLPVPHLLWEDFPLPAWDGPNGTLLQQGVSPPLEVLREDRTSVVAHYPDGMTWIKSKYIYNRKTGPMTGREVLQYWGSEIFRKAHPQVWADKCIRTIRESEADFAFITDCRFPNEVEVVHGAGGRVVRLRRKIEDDPHESELLLDEDRYDQTNFDFIMHNQNYGVYAQCLTLFDLFVAWQYVDINQVDQAKEIASYISCQ